MNNASRLILLISSLFYIGCGNNTETTTPKTADVVESVYASGIVKSENQYEVFTNSNGVVEIIFVKEGEPVKKGTPIFQIENINSKLSTENARLFSLANDYKLNKEKLSEAKISIELAQKKLANDSLLFIRHQELWRQNIGSKVELEQKELSFENSKVNLKKAQVVYEDINRQLKLASDQSKNNLKIAQATENDLIIRSEEDGYVYKINAKKGELATSMSPLAVIGQKDFSIELNVDEFDIVKIRKGQKVIVKMDSYQNQIFEAQVNFIYPMMNERTRTFKVEAVFSRKPVMLYPNLTLEANIIINEKKNVLTIPTTYLLNDSSVMLEDGTVKALKIGLKDYSITEIVSGIDKDTKIRMPKK
ncbi:MAG: efflux RND transporter periplasmic adaptor subunit [Saprospiraceae bacterium]|nr:efflux RND transporter periplasmic adaptor subunit [Saprospiraceae bacterium]MBK8298202.1 efflux RND transporter periplasmic adaptor subunit [Saprospiraceae bacterium]